MGSQADGIHAPEWREFINELGDPLLMPGSTVEELYENSNANIQKLLAKYEFPPPDTTIRTEDVRLKKEVWVRIYTPPSTPTNNTTTNDDDDNDSITVFIHGGGWIMGSIDHEDSAVRRICAATNRTVVSIGYRLAPKHEFPTALHDCGIATVWALIHFDYPPIVLMGGSAGANLAFGVGLQLLDCGLGHKVKGICALVPCVVHPDAVPADKRERFTAYDENALATTNTRAAMGCFLDSYGPPPDDTDFSVLLHPRIGELKRVYIVECGADTLRDDARLMRDALLEQGTVEVKYDAYAGFPHYFWSYPSKHLVKVSEEFHRNVFGALEWLHSE